LRVGTGQQRCYQTRRLNTSHHGGSRGARRHSRGRVNATLLAKPAAARDHLSKPIPVPLVAKPRALLGSLPAV
jgi:hypothetical protein